MNTHTCIVCDHPPPFVFVFKVPGYDYTLVRCRGCGLVFQDPQPSEEVLNASYYQDPEFSQALRGSLRQITLGRAADKLELVRGLGVVRPGASALDVGCSSGAWLETVAAHGMRATGVEVGDRTAADARRAGLDVHTGTLADALPKLEARRFDLITFWDVLEHLRDPRNELALAAGLLAPRGVLAATFPNVEGLYPRATYHLLARHSGRWEYPELPVHLYDFAPRTARALFERTGYRIVSLRTFPTPFQFYRSTTLALRSLGGGRRAVALRGAFEVLRVVLYPVARGGGRGNSMYVAAMHATPNSGQLP